MKTMNKRFIDLKVEEMQKVDSGILAGSFDLNRYGKGVDYGRSIVESYTVINQLGSYGDFENGSGLANGWNEADAGNDATPTLTTAYRQSGSYSQKYETTNATLNDSYLYRNIQLKQDHIYFFKGYIKTATNSTNVNSLGKVEVDNIVINAAGVQDKFIATSFAFTGATGNYPLRIWLKDATCEATKTYTFWADAFMLVDLTNMGVMPSGLQAFFKPPSPILEYTIVKYENSLPKETLAYWTNSLYDELHYISFAGVETTYFVSLATSDLVLASDGRNLTGNEWLNEIMPYVNGIKTVNSGTTTTTVIEHENIWGNRLEFNSELIGYFGVYDELKDDGELTKRWQKETVVITTGSGTVSKSGQTNCFLISGDGLYYDASISGTTVTTTAPNGSYTAYYTLTNYEITDVEIVSMLSTVKESQNIFENWQWLKNEFIADGIANTFNLSQTASLPYSVYVNGEEVADREVTKFSTSFTFTTAPRNGSIVQVYFNKSWVPVSISMELYEPTKFQETLSHFTELEVSERMDVETNELEYGLQEKIILSRRYEVSLNKDLIENYENFLKKYKDKKFRLIITNLRDGKVEIASVCEIEEGSSKNYFRGNERVNILATNYYVG